jgi:hypothetical protein
LGEVVDFKSQGFPPENILASTPNLEESLKQIQALATILASQHEIISRNIDYKNRNPRNLCTKIAPSDVSDRRKQQEIRLPAEKISR